MSVSLLTMVALRHGAGTNPAGSAMANLVSVAAKAEPSPVTPRRSGSSGAPLGAVGTGAGRHEAPGPVPVRLPLRTVPDESGASWRGTVALAGGAVNRRRRRAVHRLWTTVWTRLWLPDGRPPDTWASPAVGRAFTCGNHWARWSGRLFRRFLSSRDRYPLRPRAKMSR